jgi:hypothetical protein
MALGLITRESLASTKRAFLACAAVESLTLVGAAFEPLADQVGAAHFGGAWITCMLAVTGGSFLFLGFHALDGTKHKPGVIPTFLLTLCGIAALALLHGRLGSL